MALWMIVAAVLVVALGHVLVAVYLAEGYSRSKRRRVQGTPADLGLRYEEIQFLTADRLVLRGWFMESPGARATVVTVHDVAGTRSDEGQGLLQLQRDYVRRGFNVFAFDLRGRGESAGRRDTLGADERSDVLAALAYARRRTGALPLLLHGFGLGATLAILVAARVHDLAGVIADSPIASVRAYLRHRHPHVPAHVFALSAFLCRRVFRVDVDAISPVREVAGVRVPILFIHGEDDPEVPVAHTLNLAAASLGARNQVWTPAAHATHCGLYIASPEPYMRRCIDFVDEVVPARVLEAAAV